MADKTANGGADEKPPKIEFPCPDYPIKIMGLSGAEFQEFALKTVEHFAPDFDRSKATIKDSKNGTYQSMTVLITATGEQQLSDLNTRLRANELVKIVL